MRPLLNVVRDVVFVTICIILTRQVPLSSYEIASTITSLCLMLLAGTYVNKRNLGIYAASIGFFILLTGYALVREVPLGDATRFGAIICVLILAYDFRVSLRAIRIFQLLVVVQVLYVIGLGIYCSFDRAYALELRGWFLTNAYGDIYSFNEIFYRVQIKGNALIPACLMCHIAEREIAHRKPNIFLCALLIGGSIFAGNLAFWISIFLFFLIYLLHKKSYFIVFILTSVALVGGVGYVAQLLLLKGQESLPVRFDQLYGFLQAFIQNPINLLLGAGVGAKLDYIGLRDYTNSRYFEVQSVYFLYQLGLFVFGAYLFAHLIRAVQSTRRNGLLLLCYVCYLLYGITNPYIFDTNHVILITILASLAYHYRASRPTHQPPALKSPHPKPRSAALASAN